MTDSQMLSQKKNTKKKKKKSSFCLDIIVKNKSEFDIGGYNVMGS